MRKTKKRQALHSDHPYSCTRGKGSKSSQIKATVKALFLGGGSQLTFDEEAKKESLSGKTSKKVLNELLSQIKKVDFRERTGLNEDDKIARKFYVVISIEEILSTATANNWVLCTDGWFIYVFNGKYWQVININDFKRFLGDAAKKMGVPAIEADYFRFTDTLYKQLLSESNYLHRKGGEV